MTITELIALLQDARAKHGNVGVHVSDGDADYVDVDGIVLDHDDSEKVIGVIIADQETLVAFSDYDTDGDSDSTDV